jgi:hypothetical protein
MLKSIVALALLTVPAAAGTVEVSPGDNVEAVIATLQPGDELVIHGGTYSNTDRFGIDLVGTAASPIVIRAADGEHPVFTRPDAAQNMWEIDRAEYVTIRGLEFSGGSAGLRIGAGRFLTIEDCEIHGTADVALRANDPGVSYEALHIVHNHIHDTGGTGEGMYLGCNSNGCRVFNSVIERNWVHSTNGAAVSQGDGIELKEGGYGNTIRDNVIHDTGYPCILTDSTVGNGAANIIERNVMWHCGDHGIQTSADAIIRNNIILGSVANGIAMQVHQAGSPSNLVVVHNTILHPANNAISVGGITGSVVIANNALYAQAGKAIAVSGATTGLVVAGNVGVGASDAGGIIAGDLINDLIAATYSGAPPADVFPKSGSALVGAGNASYGIPDDFNGTPRDGSLDAGAYRFNSAGNPGWTIVSGFKDTSGPGAGGDIAGDGVPDGMNPANGLSDGCGCEAQSRQRTTPLWLVVAALVLRRRSRRRAPTPLR